MRGCDANTALRPDESEKLLILLVEMGVERVMGIEPT